MILLLSRRHGDHTTDLVADWLRHLGAACFRLNAEDVEYPSRFDLEPVSGLLRLADAELRLGEVRAVWYRRWRSFDQYHPRHVDGFFPDAARQHDVTQYLGLEHAAVGEAIFGALRHARWLGDPGSARIDKSRVLAVAAEVGLEVPASVVATTRAALLAFADRHGAVITKSLSGRPLMLDLGGSGAAAYTATVDRARLAAAPEVFFPTLLQEAVPKSWEVRSFILGDSVDSMAIFSQGSARTATDFRRYDDARPNRNVPYRLPDEVQARLLVMMRRLGLETGSADLIRTPDGRHVFLEVNPVGQFGMTSAPCNYQLERKVAAFLMDHARR